MYVYVSDMLVCYPNMRLCLSNRKSSANRLE